MKIMKRMISVLLLLCLLLSLVPMALAAGVKERLNADLAYVSKLEIGNYSTGTAPWDDNNERGNDARPDNRVIRTFDLSVFTLEYETKLREQANQMGIQGYRTGRVFFEFVLPLTSTQAQFEPSSMPWLDTAAECSYRIDTATIKDVDGNLVESQVLHGSFLATPAPGNVVAIGNSTGQLDVAFRVLDMKNGEEFAPQFSLWLAYNHVRADSADLPTTDESNAIPEYYVTGNPVICPLHRADGYEVKTANVAPLFEYWEKDKLVVSAKQRYNVKLTAGDITTTTATTLDFSTGNEYALDKENREIYGRLSCFGITLQLVGKDATNGLKGVEIPDAGTKISFVIKEQYELKDAAGVTLVNNLNNSEYQTRIWSAGPNEGGDTQPDGRVLSETNTYAAKAAPMNMPSTGFKNYRQGCYNGGDWSFEKYSGNNMPHRETLVTVENFEIDVSSLENIPFCDAGYTGAKDGGNVTAGYYNPDTTKNVWELQTINFSAGEIWVFAPYENAAGVRLDEGQWANAQVAINMYIDDDYIEVNGLNKNDTDIKVVTDANSGDNSYTFKTAFQRKGTIESNIYYAQYGKGWGNPLSPGQWDSVYDWATPGQKLSIYSVLNADNAEGESRVAAMETFVKFDQDFFEPDGNVFVQVYSSVNGNNNLALDEADMTVLWAATKWNSGQGWKHRDAAGNPLTPDKSNANGLGNDKDGQNYDWDMIHSYIDHNNQFYTSLDDLKADGYVCIGVLVELRGVVSSGDNHLQVRVDGKVKETCTPGYVYMTTMASRAWTVGSLKDIVSKDKKVTTDSTAWKTNYVKYTDDYVRNDAKFPTHATVSDYDGKDNKDTTYADLLKAIYWDKRENGKTPGQDHPNSLYNIQKVNYANGQPTNDTHTAFVTLLDCCLVTSHVASIDKTTAQTKEGGAGAKETYSLDRGERTVDYKLTPTLSRVGGDSNAMPDNDNSNDITVTITDVLPANLEYIPGTSYWGGTYEQDPFCINPGTVTGGTSVEPSISTNSSDGTTTLTWTLIVKGGMGNLSGLELAPVYYSCRLTGTLDNGQEISNTATIYTNLDNMRLRTPANGNQDMCTIKIQNSKGLAITKLADEPVVEIDEPMGFTMLVCNNGNEPITDMIAVDDFPYPGDGEGVFQTAFENPDAILYVSDFSVDQKFAAADSGIKFYWARNTDYNGLLSADYAVTDFTTSNGWYEIKFGEADENGMCHMTNTSGGNSEFKANITQIVAVGTLPAGGTLKMRAVMNLKSGGKVVATGGDTFWNEFNLKSLQSNVLVTVVDRSIHGKTWVDTNRNGLQDEGTYQEGINVILMQEQADGTWLDVKTITTGQQYDVYNKTVSVYEPIGEYNFYNLAPGNYKVRFEGASYSISYHSTSPINVGTNDILDSDVIPTYDATGKLISAATEVIHMPTVEELNGVAGYHSLHNDAGFYLPEIAPDVAVFDFGLPMEIDVLANDRIYLGDRTLRITGVSATAPKVDLNTGLATSFDNNYKTSITLSQGKVEVKNGKVYYTPTTTNTPGVDEFYYQLEMATGVYLYAKVTVLPASNVYFEQTFLNPTVAGWNAAGTASDRNQSGENTLHGFDNAYTGYEENSLGTYYQATVNDPYTQPTATFTFTGTGFDIISRTTTDSGVMVVDVYKDGVLQQVCLVDTYLETDSLYQLPVVHCEGLTYGQYDVTIRAYYNAAFDHNLATRGVAVITPEILQQLGYSADTQIEVITAADMDLSQGTPATKAATKGTAGSYNVYLDGIRVYHPLTATPTDETASDAYNAIGELNTSYLELREELLDASSWATPGDAQGVLYVADGTTTTPDADTTVSGVYLSTSGILKTVEENGKNYLIDADGNYITFNGQNVWVVLSDGGEPKYYAGETELTREQAKSLNLCYYDDVYRSFGPENEIYLKNGYGVAFNVTGAGIVHMSAKSPNGKPVDLCVWDGAGWITVETITSATEMYYDLSPYIYGTELIVKCSSTSGGILSICQLKTDGGTAISVNEELAYRAKTAMESSEHTHSQITSTVTAATCTTPGSITETCAVCGKSSVAYKLAAKGHTYTAVATPATCTAEGYTTYTCADCGDTYVSDTVAALAHNFRATLTQPTANRMGYTTYTCVDCGYSYKTGYYGGEHTDACDGGENCPSKQYTDVDTAAWSHESIDFVVSNGLMNGVDEQTFRPAGKMTRAMLVTVLWRLADSPEVQSDAAFEDVLEGSWYEKAVIWAKSEEIVNGVTDTRFAPDAYVTREQMAAIFFRFAAAQGYDTTARAELADFGDADQVSSYAVDALEWCVAEGILNGTDGKLLPLGNATREQIAAVLMRFVQAMDAE